MKGVEDFIYVLVAAFVILVLLSIASGVFYVPVTPTLNFTELAQFSLGTVGFVTEYPARLETIGSFTVGERQTEPLKSALQIETSSSLFGQRTEKYIIDIPTWLQEPMREVVITFTVWQTNKYGNLIVKWNGKDFYRGVAEPGSYTVRIQPDEVFSSNTLEISCDGPGLMFWASTVYVIKNFKVDLKYGPAKLHSFDVLQSELETWKKGEINFQGFDDGLLQIKVNGETIYEKIPSGIESVDFDLSTAPINLGQNIISFVAPNIPVVLQNVKLRVYLLTDEIVRTRTFEITPEQYSQLEQEVYRGKIEMDVSVIREDSLEIKINDNQLSFPKIKNGVNTIYFSASDVKAGENEIEFSGKGCWDISDVVIGLEPV